MSNRSHRSSNTHHRVFVQMTKLFDFFQVADSERYCSR